MTAPNPDSPATLTSPAPVQNLEIRSMQEFVAAIRAWRYERGITHETLDHIAVPIKNLGWQSLGDALKTLAIKLVVVEDPEQRKLVEKRWIRRERLEPARHRRMLIECVRTNFLWSSAI